MVYKRKDCVLIKSGRVWAYDPDVHDDNGWANSLPDCLGAGVVGYAINRRRRGNQTLVFVLGQKRAYWVNNEDIQPFDPTQTGDEYRIKICLNCGILRTVDSFSVNQTRADGSKVRRPRCDDCFTADSGKNMTSKVRKEYLDRHGPSSGDLWICPICKRFSIAYVNVKIVVDHDHKTGKPRGLICDSCNTGLGRFKDGESLLDAIEYIRSRENGNSA